MEDEEHWGGGLDLETWNIEQGLRNIRRRRRVFGLALVGILPYFFVTGNLMEYVGLPAFVPLVPYAAFIVYAYARLVVAECPSCGNRFFSRWSSGYNYLSSSCMHCGQML